MNQTPITHKNASDYTSRNHFAGEVLIKAVIAAEKGDTYNALNGKDDTGSGLVDRNEWRSLLRRLSIELIKERFPDGIFFDDLGVCIQSGNIIELLTNYNESGAKRE